MPAELQNLRQIKASGRCRSYRLGDSRVPDPMNSGGGADFLTEGFDQMV